MSDAWGTFPARMGDHQAFISFNQGFAEIAEGDPRTSLLSVRVPFAHPTPEGLPTGDEFADLAKIEDLLDATITAKGGVQVVTAGAGAQHVGRVGEAFDGITG